MHWNIGECLVKMKRRWNAICVWMHGVDMIASSGTVCRMMTQFQLASNEIPWHSPPEPISTATIFSWHIHGWHDNIIGRKNRAARKGVQRPQLSMAIAIAADKTERQMHKQSPECGLLANNRKLSAASTIVANIVGYCRSIWLWQAQAFGKVQFSQSQHVYYSIFVDDIYPSLKRCGFLACITINAILCVGFWCGQNVSPSLPI